MSQGSPLIVVGEASESDDEAIPEVKEAKKSVTFNGAVIVIESENDSDDNFNLTAEAFQSKFEETKQCNPKYNSLLHKKLKESNTKLQEDAVGLVKSCYRYAIEQIREIFERLHEAQTEARETQQNLRYSLIAMDRIDLALNDLINNKFMSDVNIKL